MVVSDQPSSSLVLLLLSQTAAELETELKCSCMRCPQNTTYPNVLATPDAFKQSGKKLWITVVCGGKQGSRSALLAQLLFILHICILHADTTLMGATFNSPGRHDWFAWRGSQPQWLSCYFWPFTQFGVQCCPVWCANGGDWWCALFVQTGEVQELQRQAQDVETQIRELKKAASKQTQQGAAIKRSFNSEQAALDALKMRRADLLGAAAMEQVCLAVSVPCFVSMGSCVSARACHINARAYYMSDCHVNSCDVVVGEGLSAAMVWVCEH